MFEFQARIRGDGLGRFNFMQNISISCSIFFFFFFFFFVVRRRPTLTIGLVFNRRKTHCSHYWPSFYSIPLVKIRMASNLRLFPKFNGNKETLGVWII